MRDLTRRVVAVAARLVPSGARREFRAEWEAELTVDPSLGRAIGSLPDAWCLFRQQWSLDMLTQDIRYAVRLMRHRPGYTALVVLMLALGIGANAAVFSVINGVLLRPLPFTDPSTLVVVWENDRVNHKPRYPVAPANYVDWLDQARTIAPFAAYTQGAMILTGVEEPVRLHSTVATVRFFDVLGVRPELGRAFADADMVAPQHRVAVLSHAAWMTRFAGDRGIVGRTITLDGRAFQVIGVMPRGFAFPDRETDLWRPAVLTPDMAALRAVHFLSVIGRLAPGASIDRARAEFDTIAVRQQTLYPQTNDQRGVTIVPLHEQIVGETRTVLYLLAAAVALVLLIGCANVANLMMVRATGRRREFAIRAALGADRVRLLRQMVIEGVALSASGGAAGLVLAAWLTPVLAVVAADYVPRMTDVRVDAGVLAFVTLLSIATGILFALAPAWMSSSPDVQEALHHGTRTAGVRPATARLRAGLVVAEVAIAVTLLVGTALVGRSFLRLLHVDPGFRSEHVVSGDIALPGSRYSDTAPILQFYDSVLERLRALPGVRAAGAVNAFPLSGSGPTSWFTPENVPRPSGEPPEVNYRAATPGYFEAMGIPLLAGRTFQPSDRDGLKVAIVNRALVERFLAGRDPIGQRFRLGPNPKAAWRTIVGVIGDVHEAGPDLPAQPQAYLPFAQDAFSAMTIVARADGDAAAQLAAIAGVVRSIDRDVPLSHARTMDEAMWTYLAPRRLTMLLLSVFAGLAVLLAVLGVAGVMGYTVSQRTNEIGVRLALGAGRGAILRMTLAEGARLGVAGIALGVGVSLAASRLLRGALFGITPTDAPTYAIVVVVMLAASFLACYFPARRASRVNPLTAIRAE